MVERDEAPPKLGLPNPGRGRNRILEAEPATGNNRNQGKRLGTKPGALQIPTQAGPMVCEISERTTLRT